MSSTFTSVSTLLTTVGLPNSPFDDGERRLVARLAAVALDRLEDRRLLAADVRARALADLDVEAEALAEHVVAEIPAAPRLGDRGLERVLRLGVLAADVDVAALAAGCVGGDRHRLDQRERVALHDHPVLERAGLRLVGVADEVVRAHRLPRDRLPFDAGRERGAAPALQLRVLQLADHALGAELDRASQRGVAAVGAVLVEADGLRRGGAAEQAQRRIARLRQHGHRRRPRARRRRAPSSTAAARRRRERPLVRARRPHRRRAPPERGRTGRGTGCDTTSSNRRRRARPRRRSAPRAARSARRSRCSGRRCPRRRGRRAPAAARRRASRRRWRRRRRRPAGSSAGGRAR